MPRYDYLCEGCGDESERQSTITARNDQKCELCGGTLGLIWKPATSFQPFTPYFDIGLGVDVTDKNHRAKVMRQNALDFREPPKAGDRTARLDKIHERKAFQFRNSYRGTSYSK